MKKILVVVDMQNDFLTGTLANESAVAIIPNIKKEIESGKYDHIVFTRDTHFENYLETQEGKNLPVKHCIYKSWGWNVCDELQIENPIYIDKPTFGYTLWATSLQDLYETETELEIYLTGTVTSICVVSNALALKAAVPEAKVTCISNCCADINDDNHESALMVMETCQVNVI